jgi:hypothetical protein
MTFAVMLPCRIRHSGFDHNLLPSCPSFQTGHSNFDLANFQSSGFGRRKADLDLESKSAVCACVREKEPKLLLSQEGMSSFDHGHIDWWPCPCHILGFETTASKLPQTRPLQVSKSNSTSHKPDHCSQVKDGLEEAEQAATWNQLDNCIVFKFLELWV